jgi:hypothetical protein
MLTWALVLLVAPAAWATTPRLGLVFVETQQPLEILLTMDDAQLSGLSVQRTTLRAGGIDRGQVPSVDANPQPQPEGGYRLRVPVKELSQRPTGYYVLIYDATAKSTLAGNPPLHVRKKLYLRVANGNVTRVTQKEYSEATSPSFPGTSSTGESITLRRGTKAPGSTAPFNPADRMDVPRRLPENTNPDGETEDL